MEIYDVRPTISTPKVYFDTARGSLELSGESYPENSFEFYAPLIARLKEYLSRPGCLRFDISIKYMNSSSIKCVLELFDMMEEAESKGMDIVINWFYDKDNTRALELAAEFSEEVSLPFHIIPIES
ncbi:MAG: DUF1987 domain-containing protein [Pseudomonadota bacterium]